jgi:hypothetical protein
MGGVLVQVWLQFLLCSNIAIITSLILELAMDCKTFVCCVAKTDQKARRKASMRSEADLELWIVGNP